MNIEIDKKEITGDGSELRYDLLTGEWVIIAANRGKRPDDFVSHDKKPAYDQAADPFFDPEASGQELDTLIYKDIDSEWTTRVFPNKFPAVSPDHDLHDLSFGPYGAMSGYGYHEIVVTRDAQRPYAQLNQYELAEVIDAYQERYLTLMRERGVRSITVFHNRGGSAGASLQHPHSQIIALPIVTPTVAREIAHTEKFYRQNHETVFDAVMEHELRTQSHIIAQNEDFIAYCPFASERAFQVRIMPKKHQPYFERIGDLQKVTLADVLSKALGALYKGLDDPDLNYYIRTAPCDGQDYPSYRWHIDIFPRTHIYAGFEYASGIEIVPVSPEDAAAMLREEIDE